MPTDWTLRQAQEEIKKIRRRKFPLWEEQLIQIEILDLIAEMGNFLKEYKRFHEDHPLSNTEGIKKGLGDILYSLLSVTNKLNITIQHCLNESLVCYQYDLPKRDSHKQINYTLEQLAIDTRSSLSMIDNDIKRHNLSAIPLDIIALISSAGKIAERYLKMTDYGRVLNEDTDSITHSKPVRDCL